MQQRIEKLYESYAERRNRLRLRMAALVPEVTTISPGADAWSLAQIVEHLVLVESNLLQMLKDGLEKNASDKTPGLIQSLKIKAMFFLLSLPVRVKVPTKVVLPRNDLAMEGILKTWIELDDQWRALLPKVTLAQAKRCVFKHPIVGWMNLFQLFSFLSSHLDHHLPQVERTLLAACAKLENN